MSGPDEAHGPQAGYSLVEVLIVLALLGVLSILLVSGLQFGARVWETGERQSQTLRQIALAQVQMREWIAGAYPVISTADPARPRVAFEGGEHELTLIAFDPTAGASTRSTISIGRAEADGGLALRVSTTPQLAIDPGARTTRRLLLRGIKEIRFDYLGEETQAWANAWKDQRRLPRLVRVSVSFPEGDGRVWPDLIVAPRIAADVACVFDALGKSCSGR